MAALDQVPLQRNVESEPPFHRITPEILRTILSFYVDSQDKKDNKRNTVLLDQYIHFFTTIVQDDKCLAGGRTSSSLRDMLCATSIRYTPIPSFDDTSALNKQLARETELSNGSFGVVYSWTSDGPVSTEVLKCPLQLDQNSLQEMIINYVIVNTILLHGKLTEHLVATYGVFLSSTNTVSFNGDIRTKRPIQFGFNDSFHGSSKPQIHMIQQRIQGITLAQYIQHHPFTVDQCRSIIEQVWTILIALEASPYQITHNDLHAHNIMIKPDGTVVIIDWGMASFTIGGIDVPYTHRKGYTNSLQRTGVHDLFRLLTSIYNAIPPANLDQSALSRYLWKLGDSLCSQFCEEINVHDYTKEQLAKKTIYDLGQRERALRLLASGHFGSDDHSDEVNDMDEREEITLSPTDLQTISTAGRIRNIPHEPAWYSYMVRKDAGFPDGIPLLNRKATMELTTTYYDEPRLLFDKMKPYRNFYKFLMDVEYHTTSSEMQDQLHALHVMILGTLTYARLGEIVLGMTSDKVKVAQGMASETTLQSPFLAENLGRRKKKKKHTNQKDNRKVKKTLSFQKKR